MKNLKLLLALLFIAMVPSCSNENDSSTDDSNNSGKVFVVGTEKGQSTILPILWTNGELTNLPTVANTDLSDLKIIVQNNDVYIVGVEINLDTRMSSIVLWKNGVQSRFSQAANSLQIYQMIVDNGNVYVLGSERLEGGVDKFRYWKNGFATTIINSYVVVGNDFKENNVEKMVVANNDVYCIGTEFNATGTIRTAKFWKNAVPTSITDFKGNFDSLADIQVNGTEISILYDQVNPTTLRPEVKLWKNNTTSVIATGNNGFSATAMIIKDGVEHILINEGITFDGTKILYLKNRTKTEITDGTTDVQRSYLRVDGSNVCVAYEIDSGFSFSSKYWLNGTTNILNNDGVFEINAVFLAEKDVYITSAKSNNLPKLWTNGKETISKTNSTTSSYKVNDVFVTQ